MTPPSTLAAAPPSAAAQPTPEAEPEHCRIGLPSSSAVEDLLDGKASAIFPVLLSMAARGALVSAGAYVAGVRGENVIRAGVGGAVFIEAFVFAWTAWKRKSA